MRGSELNKMERIIWVYLAAVRGNVRRSLLEFDHELLSVFPF